MIDQVYNAEVDEILKGPNNRSAFLYSGCVIYVAMCAILYLLIYILTNTLILNNIYLKLVGHPSIQILFKIINT